jgi:putative transposase
LRQAEAGTPVMGVCRSLGISEATFYIWKKKYGHLGASKVRRLRQLEEENARLKRVVADLTLDKNILQDIIRKKADADTPPGNCSMDHRNMQGER